MGVDGHAQTQFPQTAQQRKQHGARTGTSGRANEQEAVLVVHKIDAAQ